MPPGGDTSGGSQLGGTMKRTKKLTKLKAEVIDMFENQLLSKRAIAERLKVSDTLVHRILSGKRGKA